MIKPLIKVNEDQEIEFYTKSGLIVANGYERVVHGGRGDYVEFTGEQICIENMFIPKEEEWRTKSDKKGYFIEYRTDKDKVMVYLQKKLVGYADYKIGLYYISPGDLYVYDNGVLTSVMKLSGLVIEVESSMF